MIKRTHGGDFHISKREWYKPISLIQLMQLHVSWQIQPLDNMAKFLQVHLTGDLPRPIICRSFRACLFHEIEYIGIARLPFLKMVKIDEIKMTCFILWVRSSTHWRELACNAGISSPGQQITCF